jgi:predicted nucleic acid-binding protein
MTVALDTSALLARYLEGAEHQLVLRTMRADPDWCASALALSEALLLAGRVTRDEWVAEELRRAIHDDWQRVAVVPVDGRCLDEAAELGRNHPVGTVTAIHLAAASRLPPPVTYVTFDSRQIPVALALGFDVVST